MKIVYFDAGSGISGDMAIGALLDAGAPHIDLPGLSRALELLPVAGYRLSRESVNVAGIPATSFDVVLDSSASRMRRDWQTVRLLIQEAGRRGLAAAVVDRALRVFAALAEAEAAVHGVPVDTVHFHEVGALDAIVDIVGTAWCLDRLGIEACFVGPLPSGTGFTDCDHGRLPVPAPATVRLLAGFEVIAGDGEGELVTPTGAAILSALARPIRPMMTIERTGNGAGKRRWQDRPNVLRVFLGDCVEDSDRQVVVIEADIDDMTPVTLAIAAERLRVAGAIDVTLLPLQMKKGRLGFRLTVLCGVGKLDDIARSVLTETSSLGLRMRTAARMVLPRRTDFVETRYGKIAVKVGVRPSGEHSAEPEFEDVARAAIVHGVSFTIVRAAALAAWQKLPDQFSQE